MLGPRTDDVTRNRCDVTRGLNGTARGAKKTPLRQVERLAVSEANEKTVQFGDLATGVIKRESSRTGFEVSRDDTGNGPRGKPARLPAKEEGLPDIFGRWKQTRHFGTHAGNGT